jgi:hypothetical protein
MASNKMSVNCFAASHAADRLAVASTAKTRRARSWRRSRHAGYFAVNYNQVIGYVLQNREGLFGPFYPVHDPSLILEVLYDRATEHV